MKQFAFCSVFLMIVSTSLSASAEGYSEINGGPVIGAIETYLVLNHYVSNVFVEVKNGERIALAQQSDPLKFQIIDSSNQSVDTVSPTDRESKVLTEGTYSLHLLEKVKENNLKWDIIVLDSENNVKKGRLFFRKLMLGAPNLNLAKGSDLKIYARVPTKDSKKYVIEINLKSLMGAPSFILLVTKNGINNARYHSAKASLFNDNGLDLFLNPPEYADYEVVPARKGPDLNVDVVHDGNSNSCSLFTLNEKVQFIISNYSPLNTYVNIKLVCEQINGTDPSKNTILLDADLQNAENLNNGNLKYVWTPNLTGENIHVRCHANEYFQEFHFLAHDLEVLLGGVRFFHMLSKDSSKNQPLNMWWDDLPVYNKSLDNNKFGDVAYSLLHSPYSGLNSGSYTDAPIPYCDPYQSGANSRGWGGHSKSLSCKECLGEGAILNTYSALRVSSSKNIDIFFTKNDLDSDNDGLSDIIEECILKSKKDNADSDGDGINDYEECQLVTINGNEKRCKDTDGDGRPDLLESCGDGYSFDGDACDDSNSNDGDGCSRDCKIEDGFACPITKVGQCLEVVCHQDNKCGAGELCVKTKSSEKCICKKGFSTLDDIKCNEIIKPKNDHINTTPIDVNPNPIDDVSDLNENDLYMSGSSIGCSVSNFGNNNPSDDKVDIMLFFVVAGLFLQRKRRR